MLDVNIEIAKDPENPERDIILCKEKGLRIRVYDTTVDLELPQNGVNIFHDNNRGDKLMFNIMDREVYEKAHGWDALIYNYAIDWYLSFPGNAVAKQE